MKYTEEMILHSDRGYCMPFEEPRGKDVELSLGYGEQVHPTTGATRPHERPATASTIPKPSTEKTQEIKRPATATTSKASEPVKTSVIKERPLSSGASDRKATQLTQQVHRQNVEKVVLQETRQNYPKDRRKKVQQTHSVQKNQQTTEKSRNLVTKKGQKKK